MKKLAKEILATNLATLTSIVVLLKLNEMKRKLLKSNLYSYMTEFNLLYIKLSKLCFFSLKLNI